MAPALVDRDPHIACCRTLFTAMFILITFLENFKHIKKNIFLLCASLLSIFIFSLQNSSRLLIMLLNTRLYRWTEWLWFTNAMEV